jgi:hypothetical protein
MNNHNQNNQPQSIMKKTTSLLTAAAIAVSLLSACKDSDDGGSTESSGTAAVDPKISAVFIETEPADAVIVSELRKTAKPGDTVTLVGKIAGAKTPFTEGFATAVVSDIALKTCDLIPGDTCETPWDACCADPDHIKATRLTIQVLGDDDRPVAQSLKGVNGLKELDPIVVTGTVAEGSTPENLVVNVGSLFQQNK